MSRTTPTAERRRIRPQIPLMALTLVALLAGLWAGLSRLGWQLPPLSPHLAAQHGPLMVSGFLGALISLERAVALSQGPDGRRLYYLAPFLAALGALAGLLAFPALWPRLLSLLGALGLVLIFVVINRRQPNIEHAVMGLGALLWLAGNGLWLAGRPLFQVAPWWAGFLVLTIAGERLELTRILLHKAWVRTSFTVIVAGLTIGLLLSLINFGAGIRATGLALIALGIWLWRFDIARRTIRKAGLTRFIAACLLPGYLWLTFSGALWLRYGHAYVAGPLYDAMLHTIFLGFVVSMIFGHAPVIFPAVLGVKIAYTPLFYGHLILLHLSLTLRVAGDLLLWPPGRHWGGLLNEIALLLFLLVTALSAVTARRSREAEPAPIAGRS